MPLLEFQALDDYVLLHKSDDPSRWLAQGFSPIDPNFVAFHLALAAERVDRCELERLLFELTLEPVPRTLDLLDLQDRLANAVSLPWYVLLRRPLARVASPYELPKLPEPAGPPRLDTEHYLVVEARDERGKPVRGVQLELVIAGGEVKRALTDQDGTARVERIHAGRVVIRVLALDGSMWRPESGEGSKPSGSDSGRWHVVRPGESLSRIARQHGLKNWKALWDDPRNEPLREKRKNPNVIHPGDDVHVPGARVHEIIRETDAAHRVVVDERRCAVAVLNLHLVANRSAVRVEWSEGETTLGSATTAYSDQSGVVLRVPVAPEHMQLALVPPPVGAIEADASEQRRA